MNINQQSKVTITINLDTKEDLESWYAIWDNDLITDLIGYEVTNKLQVSVTAGYNPTTCLEFDEGVQAHLNAYIDKQARVA